MSRGRPPIIKQPEYTPKFTRTYEDQDTSEVWIYDLNKFTHGPILVEIKYKNGLDKDKNWNKMQRNAKNERRITRQMKNISKNKI